VTACSTPVTLAGVLIETDRLLLRPLTVADLDDIDALNAMSEVVRTMGSVDRLTAAARLELGEREWRDRGYGLMAVIERATGRFLGRSGLKYWPQFGETEVGWVLRSDVWGHGFATEAGRACIEWGFGSLGLTYLTAMIRPDNDRSIRVAERLGMRRLRPDVLVDIPVVVYVIGRRASVPQTG
jgi:RimJ/RimL family protein N-acetyltransferase